MSAKPYIVIAYHGGPEPIRAFSPRHGAQGLMWFSEDRKKIERGESGAGSTRYIMTVKLKVRNVAGWREYDQLMLAQIFSKTYGFDAIRLDHGEDGADWALRDPRRVEVVAIEERPAGGWARAGRASGRAAGRAAGRATGTRETRAAAGAIKFRLDPDNFGSGYYLEPRGRLVAVVGGKDAGFLDFLRYPNQGGVTAEFLSVKPEFRGRGVGEALLVEFKRYLRSRYPGIKYIFSDATSKRSLRVAIRALGAPVAMDNDIRMVTLREAMALLPESLEVDERGNLDAGGGIRLMFATTGRKRVLGLDEMPKGLER